MTGLPLLFILVATFGGYLLGSIPFGLLLTRAAGLGDIRTIGSGNIGATNVLRTGNRKLAAATLLLDGLKGTVAVLLARHLGAENGLLPGLVAGAGAFFGHLFPIWLGFRGGKGVATYLGILLAVFPLAVIAFAMLWLGTARITRYSSLGALVATALTPGALYLWGQQDAALLFLVLTIVTWFKHQANIRRLLSGTESKIGQKG